LTSDNNLKKNKKAFFLNYCSVLFALPFFRLKELLDPISNVNKFLFPQIIMEISTTTVAISNNLIFNDLLQK